MSRSLVQYCWVNRREERVTRALRCYPLDAIALSIRDDEHPIRHPTPELLAVEELAEELVGVAQLRGDDALDGRSQSNKGFSASLFCTALR